MEGTMKEPTLWECRKEWRMYLALRKGEEMCLSVEAKRLYARAKDKVHARFMDMMNRRRARKYHRNTCAALSSRIGAQVEGKNNV
jgi:hypothetical protein